MPTTTVNFARRGVSPVQFETLEPDLDEVLCPGSDAEETHAQRRKRKRRVEEAAQEYMRGRGLYIASARLKGPFPDDWMNPYLKKRRGGATPGNALSRWQNSYERGRSQNATPRTQDSVRLGIGKDATPHGLHREHLIRQTGRTPKSRVQANHAEEARATPDSFVTALSGSSNKVSSVKLAEISSSGARGWLKTDGPTTRQEGFVAEAFEANAADGGHVGEYEGGVGEGDDCVEGDVGAEV